MKKVLIERKVLPKKLNDFLQALLKHNSATFRLLRTCYSSCDNKIFIAIKACGRADISENYTNSIIGRCKVSDLYKTPRTIDKPVRMNVDRL